MREAELKLNRELVGRERVCRAKGRERVLGPVGREVRVAEQHLRGGVARVESRGRLKRADGLAPLPLLQENEADGERSVLRVVGRGGRGRQVRQRVGVALHLLISLAEEVVARRAYVSERDCLLDCVGRLLVAAEREVYEPRIDERVFDAWVRLRGDDVREGRERVGHLLEVHAGDAEPVVGLDVASVGAHGLLVLVARACPVALT